jgi:type VI secretion system protein ImpH
LQDFLGDAREKEDGVAPNLAYFDFNFFQAVRLLCRLQPDGKPGGFRSPETEIVRFGAHNDLAFPPHDIHSVVWSAADDNGTYPPVEMTVCFMGLTGPSGVLPWAYTEHVRQLALSGDRALTDFLNIFDHRFISLLYRAWEKYRFFVRFEREQSDALTGFLLALTGLGTEGLQDRQEIPDRAILFYCGIFSLLPRSAAALQQLLSGWFHIPVRVDQFQGSWHRLRPTDRCRFTDPPASSDILGSGVLIGDAVYDCGSRVRIRLGPLALASYRAFLPGGADHLHLRALTDFFANGNVEFEIQLVLDRGEVPPIHLGEGSVPLRLGWTTWMNTRSQRTSDPDDTSYLLS